MLRAVLEGVAFEIKAILDALADRGVTARRLRVNGGGCGLREWSRLQASVYGLELETVQQQQATLLGAAILGAVGIGAAGSLASACAQMVRVAETFRPDAAWEAAYRDVFRRHQRLGRMIRRPSERQG